MLAPMVVVLILLRHLVAADRLSELRLEWRRLETEQQLLHAKKTTLERSLRREALRKSFYDAVAHGFDLLDTRPMTESFTQGPQSMGLNEQVPKILEEMREKVEWDYESARTLYFSVLASDRFSACLDPLVKLNAFEPPVHHPPTEYEVGKMYEALKRSIPNQIAFKRGLDAWDSHFQQLIARRDQEAERKNGIIQAVEEAGSSNVLGSAAAAVLDNTTLALAIKLPCSRWSDALKRTREAIMRDEMHAQCLEALRDETRRYNSLQLWFSHTAPLLFQLTGPKEIELLRVSVSKVQFDANNAIPTLPMPKAELMAVAREDARLWELISRPTNMIGSVVLAPLQWLRSLEEKTTDLERRRKRLIENEAAWKAAYAGNTEMLFAREISRLEVLDLDDSSDSMSFLVYLWKIFKEIKYPLLPPYDEFEWISNLVDLFCE
jgi:hypothetical protein